MRKIHERHLNEALNDMQTFKKRFPPLGTMIFLLLFPPAAVVLSEYTTAAVTEWEKASYLPAPATIYNHLETSKQYLTQVPEREQKYRY